MKTIRVIDLLNKIANGEDVPKKIKVNDLSIPPYYRELTFDEDLQLYIHNDEQEFTSVLDNYHLNYEVEIIEDKENKLINPIEVFTDDNGYSYYIYNEYGTKCSLSTHDKIIVDKINEIIDRLNYELKESN